MHASLELVGPLARMVVSCASYPVVQPPRVPEDGNDHIGEKAKKSKIGAGDAKMWVQLAAPAARQRSLR